MLVIMESWKQDHILNDFPLMYAHITDIKSTLAEISFQLRVTGHILFREKKKVVSMKVSGCE